MWYNKVVQSLDNLPDAIQHFEDELEWAKKNDLNMKGRPIEKISAEVPGVVEQRYNQLQEIEAILEHLNIQLQKLRTSKFRGYLEQYNHALSSRDAGIYADWACAGIAGSRQKVFSQLASKSRDAWYYPADHRVTNCCYLCTFLGYLL